MKYSIDDSMQTIMSRSRKIKVKSKRRQIASLTVSAAIVFMSLVAILYEYIGFGDGITETSAYGALMLSDEAGGYVLVGVISFILAVILTLVCMRIANRNKDSPGDLKKDDTFAGACVQRHKEKGEKR